MAQETLTARQLNRATLARQMLLERETVPAAAAVARLGGLQAQEPRPPFAGLWTRVDGFAREDLAAALQEGDVVRGLLHRGTLHLVTAEDYAAWRGPLAPVARTALRRWGDAIDVDAVVKAARALLTKGPRTTDELRELLAEKFPDADPRGLGSIARSQLHVVLVPSDDRWGFPRSAQLALGPKPKAGGDPAGLVRRHLAAFGPATVADTQSWSGLRGLKPAFEGLRDELVTFRDERKRELFDLPDAPRPDEGVDAPPRFLPDFDNLVLAHDDRSRLLADEHRGEVVTKNLRVKATFLVDGMVAGTWALERKGKKATLRVAPFGKVNQKVRKALTAEGEQLARFLEPDAESVAVAFA